MSIVIFVPLLFLSFPVVRSGFGDSSHQFTAVDPSTRYRSLRMTGARRSSPVTAYAAPPSPRGRVSCAARHTFSRGDTPGWPLLPLWGNSPSGAERSEAEEECGRKLKGQHNAKTSAQLRCTPFLSRHGLRRATLPPGEGIILSFRAGAHTGVAP